MEASNDSLLPAPEIASIKDHDDPRGSARRTGKLCAFVSNNGSCRGGFHELEVIAG